MSHTCTHPHLALDLHLSHLIAMCSYPQMCIHTNRIITMSHFSRVNRPTTHHHWPVSHDSTLATHTLSHHTHTHTHTHTHSHTPIISSLPHRESTTATAITTTLLEPPDSSILSRRAVCFGSSRRRSRYTHITPANPPEQFKVLLKTLSHFPLRGPMHASVSNDAAVGAHTTYPCEPAGAV